MSTESPLATLSACTHLPLRSRPCRNRFVTRDRGHCRAMPIPDFTNATITCPAAADSRQPLRSRSAFSRLLFCNARGQFRFCHINMDRKNLLLLDCGKRMDHDCCGISDRGRDIHRSLRFGLSVVACSLARLPVQRELSSETERQFTAYNFALHPSCPRRETRSRLRCLFRHALAVVVGASFLHFEVHGQCAPGGTVIEQLPPLVRFFLQS